MNNKNYHITGADLGFQVRGAHFKKLRRAEGGTKICWVFRVKNHDFTPKNHIFNLKCLQINARPFGKQEFGCSDKPHRIKISHFTMNYRNSND
jgi:hypothetical protein